MSDAGFSKTLEGFIWSPYGEWTGEEMRAMVVIWTGTVVAYTRSWVVCLWRKQFPSQGVTIKAWYVSSSQLIHI